MPKIRIPAVPVLHSHRLPIRPQHQGRHASTAVFFPGQASSESPGMLTPLLHHFPAVARAGLDAVAEALDNDPDLPTIVRLLTTTTRDDADDRLMRTTSIAQPCILLCSLLTWQVLRDHKPAAGITHPGETVFLGHSLGQITAFAAAGTIPLVDALRIVRKRGLAMEAATAAADIDDNDNRFGMVAVPIKSNTTIADLLACARQMRQTGKLGPDDVVDVANLNSPSQVVLSGHVAALDKLVAELGLRKTTKLPARIPFHSRLLRPVESRMRGAVDEAKVVMPPPAACRFLRNSDAHDLTTAHDIRESIVSGCWEQVDWVRSVRRAHDEYGVRHWLGVGPASAVTAALVRRCLDSSSSVTAYDPTKTGGAWDAFVVAAAAAE
ncbi:acyl transferase/acyl hydrolase/lysophospholipase [Lipomyces tetrasporus]|uniref:[acyl-carrier-protein] S-malonyltransferase n=1 Tax=Lipomyces tetrasporus TaxID=54092 RepID=A0AAD7QPG2_9ASCO|nr:acyl transferase/acyl hydrolase/lysophospholipase [Lipomyces tetrasporus]KAJ8099035.1 acyl transferase/acyl hydrolase/lysophospholipase [Lipomyces tetrasporus]